MINKKRTVLVIGAGASVPFGFPTGVQLLKEICDKLSSKSSEEYKFLLQCTPQPSNITAFRDALSRSGQPSVDAFLEHRPEFIDVGKAAIAMVLMPYERTEALFEGKSQENWYQYLFGLLSTSFEKFDQNKFSVITFNYDRSLEHYLFTAFKNTYPVTQEECAEKLSSIPIIHVYGKLGPLPWEKTEKQRETPISPPLNVVPFDSICDSDLTSHEDYEYYKNEWHELASNSINIIHEGIENNEEFNRAHELLKDAERIYFLGFGYHPNNIQRLGLESLVDGKDICGTVLGLSLQRIKMVEQLLFHTTTVPPRAIKQLIPIKIYDFLHDNVVLD